MNEPIKIKTNIAPSIIENLGNGNWYYNYNIETIQDINEEGNPVTMYQFVQIKTKGKPTYKKCVESIIRLYLTQSQEFDLINSANKALLNDQKSSYDVLKYQEYLNLLETIKSNVAKDLL